VQRALDTGPRIGTIAEWISKLAPPDDCATATSPGSADPALPDLYARFARIFSAPKPERAAAFRELAAEASRHGDPDLATAAEIEVARQTYPHDPVVADRELQDLFRRATALGAIDLAGSALHLRARIARATGGEGEAKALAELAGDLARDPRTSPATAGSIHHELGRLARERGDRKAALQHLTEGRRAIAEHTLPMLEVELLIEQSRLLASDGDYPRAVAAGRAAVRIAKDTAGEASMRHVAALGALAGALQATADRVEAKTVRAYLRTLLSKVPLEPSDPQMLTVRNLLALELMDLDAAYGSALEETTALLAAAARSPVMRPQMPLFRAVHGYALWGLGRYEDALAATRTAVDEQLGETGPDHPATTTVRTTLLGQLIELRQLDEAERVVAELDRAYGRRPQTPVRQLAHLKISKARIALERGRAKEAERLARRANAELSASGNRVVPALVMIGAALNAQRRWRAARAVYTDLIASDSDKPLTTAVYEVGWARASYELGDRRTGLARLRAAHRVLSQSFEGPSVRRQAARWLASYERPRRGRQRCSGRPPAALQRRTKSSPPAGAAPQGLAPSAGRCKREGSGTVDSGRR
jgi:tetratricopeptide (TPR) repeat protein